MERLHLEEQHHNKLHEETFEEVLDTFADAEEERITIREEISKMIGEFVTARAGKSAINLEKQAVDTDAEYQSYLRGELPDPRD